MDHLEPARPRGMLTPREREKGDLEPARPAGMHTPCERELEEKNVEIARLREELDAKNAENARLTKRVAELEDQLGVAKKWPDLGPPAGPLRPYPPEGPWGKGPGGPGAGP